MYTYILHHCAANTFICMYANDYVYMNLNSFCHHNAIHYIFNEDHLARHYGRCCVKAYVDHAQ